MILDPATIAAVIFGVLILATYVYYAFEYLGPAYGANTEEDKDQVDDCERETDSNYARCVDAAQGLPSGFPLFLREASVAGCYGDWLIRLAGCQALIF